MRRVVSVARQEAKRVTTELSHLMWTQAGIVREGAPLQRALERIAAWKGCLAPGQPTREGIETRNLILLGDLICRGALAREESRGAHFRSDFPAPSASWRRHLEWKSSPAPDLPRQL